MTDLIHHLILMPPHRLLVVHCMHLPALLVPRSHPQPSEGGDSVGFPLLKKITQE